MTKHSSRSLLSGLVAVLGLGLYVVGGPGSARAALGAPQFLAGGASGNGAGTRFTAPGLSNIYGVDFPGANLGEQAAQVRMPDGTLRKLKVTVVPDGSQTSGSVTVTVRVNGNDTDLTCSVDFTGGDCKATGIDVVLLSDDRLAIKVVSTLNGGFWAFTYSVRLE